MCFNCKLNRNKCIQEEEEKEKKRTKNVTKKNDQAPSNIKCNLFIWIKKNAKKENKRKSNQCVYK